MVENALQVTTAAGVVAVGLVLIIVLCASIIVLAVVLFFALTRALGELVRGE